ncbi:hypothetical protein A6X21_23135 [Planctopirus hydrillae]|uniref:Uncharacterized protein n=1 Tax=Planctopirus hydrillae TaxID=1841610 RepID=A0A1C3ECV8_9PLAN|nr:hypothetical protein A6X21_23135 [Planctopirus hydrillae]
MSSFSLEPDIVVIGLLLLPVGASFAAIPIRNPEYWYLPYIVLFPVQLVVATRYGELVRRGGQIGQRAAFLFAHQCFVLFIVATVCLVSILFKGHL